MDEKKPARECPDCGAAMHHCAPDVESFDMNGNRYVGCVGRDIGTHPREGEWFMCLPCGTKVPA